MKEQEIKEIIIPEHESGVRKLMSESQGIKYKAFKNFEEAKKHSNAYMIMQGDYGGQIYLSAPVQQIKCDYKALENLLKDIDYEDPDGARIFFEEMEPGQGIAGGMGGGLATDGLWVHKGLEKQYDRIKEVLDGKRNKIKKRKNILKTLVTIPVFIKIFFALAKQDKLNKKDKE